MTKIKSYTSLFFLHFLAFSFFFTLFFPFCDKKLLILCHFIWYSSNIIFVFSSILPSISARKWELIFILFRFSTFCYSSKTKSFLKFCSQIFIIYSLFFSFLLDAHLICVTPFCNYIFVWYVNSSIFYLFYHANFTPDLPEIPFVIDCKIR